MVSRVAKNPIKIPAGVSIKISDHDVLVKGKLGELKEAYSAVLKVIQEDGHIQVAVANDAPESDALAGTTRALLQNMVDGVSTGFTKKLILIGVGYRAKVQGHDLDLSVGLSHPMVIKMPKGITVDVPSNTEIVLKGANKQLVCQVAANIRAVRPPEPYKGKGIRYENEEVILKEGKKK